MPHACAASPREILAEGSEEALRAARARIRDLRDGDLTRTLSDVMFLYEIVDPRRPGTRQIGLGGLAPAKEILTDATPDGTIVRNEGIRPKKAKGRADLIQATRAIIGTVNNTVEDLSRNYVRSLEDFADRREPDFSALAEDGCRHTIRLLPQSAERDHLVGTLRAEPFAYVADGNHRSAAAAMLGLDGFMTVVFPASRMGLAPYNRLVVAEPRSAQDWRASLEASFRVGPVPTDGDYQPSDTHRIGFYADGAWLQLIPRDGTYDSSNAEKSIDAAIVQSRVFGDLCGIPDPRDGRLTFVGGDRDAAYLRRRVDAGEFALALTLPPVTMEQFVAVCRQRRMMPPKSTWFSPKIRSGLVVALLD